jgi:uncharacterized protein
LSAPRLEAGPTRITGRAAGGWLVGDRLYPPALLITASFAASLPGLTLETLDAAGLPALEGVELLLLGTGQALRRTPPAFAQGLRVRGWRVEPMDSAAAARTFNVLAGEQRLVAALIL